MRIFGREDSHEGARRRTLTVKNRIGTDEGFLRVHRAPREILLGTTGLRTGRVRGGFKRGTGTSKTRSQALF